LFLRHDARIPGNSMKNQEKRLLWATLIVCSLLLSAALLESSSVAAASRPSSAMPRSGVSAWLDGSDHYSASAGATSPQVDGYASASPAPQDAAGSAKPQDPPAKDSGMVWVNTEAGVYHKPGSRWYGKTKKGKYMLESDAVRAGYKPAKPGK
jgi:hypothetical protein